MSSSVDEFELTTEQTEHIHTVFNQYDNSGEGAIAVHNLKDLLRSLDFNLKGEELKELMSQADNGCGSCDFKAFLTIFENKMREKQEEEFYKDMFRILDKEKKGFITCDDLRYILMGLAEQVDLTKDDVDQMILDVDEDGNGEVSYEEFRNLMTSE